ncbi:MAG: ribonuclease J [Deltaproteobacteria bacterium]|nr:ribonuclease J [Deltaproteobacteria bacterium]
MSLKIIPLGGLGEIGLNMMAFECDDSLFVVDAGLMFPEDHMLGVDFVIPDMDYLRQNRSRLTGIVLTHGHEDHIGALYYLLKEINVPVFGTPFTLGMVRHRLEEFGILHYSTLHSVVPGDKIRLGVFEIEFIRVSHSVVDCVGLAIYTPFGLVVHTGDFKISNSAIPGMNTDVARFALCGDEGVLALLSDSTNVEKKGYTASDREIGDNLAGIAQQSKGRIIIALFASSIVRIQQIVDIAASRGRKIAFNGKSIEISVHIAKNLGYLTIPEGMEIYINQINAYPDHEIVIVTTGSQGEPMSALARMASGIHKKIKIKQDDTVILSSKFIPGNERAIAKIINNLFRKGADVIYEKISNIHVSGHAFQEELKLMIQLTRPRYFVPVHGEYRHLVLHARLAMELGIARENIFLVENGQAIEFNDGARLQERVDTGRILIDGKGIGDVGKSVLKERRVLSEDGIVGITMAFDEATGIVIYGPEVFSRGFVFETATGHLLEDAVCVILEVVEDIPLGTPGRVDLIRTRMQTALRKYFDFTIHRHPIILPFFLEV